MLPGGSLLKAGIAMFAISLSALPVSDAFGHGGGTNADGCHTNRSTGDYHCHGPKTPRYDRVTYCHVVRGERRCGYALSTCSSLAGRFGGYCVPQ